MSFPLGFEDLSLWLAISAIILLITSELLSTHYGKTDLHINNKRLKNVGLAVSILFLITIVIRIITIILSY